MLNDRTKLFEFPADFQQPFNNQEILKSCSVVQLGNVVGPTGRNTRITEQLFSVVKGCLPYECTNIAENKPRGYFLSLFNLTDYGLRWRTMVVIIKDTDQILEGNTLYFELFLI